jgi:hypothetical protein
MPNITKRTADPPTPARPPSLTELQRRLLADPYRLEGEQDVPWTPPSVRNPEAVKRVAGELERGLLPAQIAFAKWCCDKLSVLPTQNADGLSAAIWTDNLLDACARYADDLWQTATLELLRSSKWRPTPAEMVAICEPRHAERQRMLARARSLLAPAPGVTATTAEQPTTSRLERLQFSRAMYERLGRPADVARMDREIAREEGEMGNPTSAATVSRETQPAERPPFVPSTSPSAKRCAELAVAKRTGTPPPEHRDIPEAV